MEPRPPTRPVADAKISATVLRVDQITKEFESVGEPLRILDGVSFELAAGESLAILGPSGAGKSTLLQILGGLDPPTSGRIFLDGTNPYELASRELAHFRNSHVGFIFQDHYLLPQLTSLENVLIPVLARQRIQGPAVERGKQLLAEVGLSTRMDHRPGQLSGGERQRVAVARALMMRPRLVLADEPTGNLDAANAQNVGQILCELAAREMVILVGVTHSESLASKFQRRATLVEGRLLEHQAADDSSQPSQFVKQ